MKADLSYLREFSGGNDAFIVKVIDKFLENTPEALGRLRNGVQSGDWDTVRAVSHKMLSSIDIVGIHELKNLLREAEDNAAARTNLNTLPDKIAQITAICEEAMAELKKEKERIASSGS